MSAAFANQQLMSSQPGRQIIDDVAPPKRELSMMAWLATEGGRKCPACGKYAKADELGYTGGTMMMGGVLTHISSYGHLPGYGCHRSPNEKDQATLTRSAATTQNHE